MKFLRGFTELKHKRTTPGTWEATKKCQLLIFSSPVVPHLLPLDQNTLYHSLSAYLVEKGQVCQKTQKSFMCPVVLRSSHFVAFSQMCTIPQNSYWNKTKCTFLDSLDFCCSTTGLCPLGHLECLHSYYLFIKQASFIVIPYPGCGHFPFYPRGAEAQTTE